VHTQGPTDLEVFLMPFSVGQSVSLRCKVQPGPFSDEPLVTIDSVGGPVSGFVRAEELVEGPDREPRVRAVVRSIEGQIVEVWIKGSFFTTNGLTHVPQEMALVA
jgi:hypothetical protein